MVELVDLAPTIHELCGYNVTPPLQGKSLLPLIDAKTTKHRDYVVVEYAPNEEVMIRDRDWKLVFERGIERRSDGYDTGRPRIWSPRPASLRWSRRRAIRWPCSTLACSRATCCPPSRIEARGPKGGSGVRQVLLSLVAGFARIQQLPG
jgi:hypothetical protein